MSAVVDAVAASAGVQVGREQEERLAYFFREIATWSRRMHLVGRGRIEETVRVQAVDSARLLRFTIDSLGREPGRGTRVADIGSGAGFPALIWKILMPGMELTCFERREKPLMFLERVIGRLGMKGVSAEGMDAERFTPEHLFDIATSKAAGRLRKLLPIAISLIGPGGSYFTVKGEGWREELSASGDTGMRFEASNTLPEERGWMLYFKRIP